MFRMKPIGTGKAAAARAELYYTRTDGGYYHDGQGLQSEWGGKGAEKLGLAGTPEFDQFRNLLYGLEPHSGEQLTARLRDNRIPAWDVTASVPKGVTLALEAGDDRIHGALWAANREAMAMLETYATTRVRAGDRHDDRVTGNLVWYSVEHAETRPVEDENRPENDPWRTMPDPDRHLHNVVLNVTYDEQEERWKAVKFRPVMDLRKFFDRSFDALLAAKLAGLGYGIETKWKAGDKGTGRYFSWDIAGIPESVVAKNSRRTGEVDATEAAIVAERQEADATAPDRLSAVARDQLGATSRKHKRDDLTLEECRAFWASRLTDGEREGIASVIEQARSRGHATPELSVEQAADFAVRHHFEQESVVRLETLMTTALERGMGVATPERVEAALRRLGVVTVMQDGERLATTPEVLAEERAMAAFALAGRGAVAPIGVADGLSPEPGEGRRLNRGQWDAVTGLLSSENRINVLLGPAGSGKSALFAKFDEGARLAGQTVTYLGTTATAVRVLREDGFKSDTLARFLLDERMQEAARGGRVVVDEASMIGHAQAVQLLKIAKEKNLKLIVSGDPRQHGSIGRGAFLRLLTDYGHCEPFRLTEIMRQESPEYRDAAGLLYEGRAAEGFDALDRLGWVHEIEDGGERVQRMAAEYVQASDELEHLPPQARVLAVSPTHAEGERLAAEIRRQLQANDRLGSDEREFLRLTPVMLSEAERGDAATYRPGETLVLQFHQNAPGFRKGERLTVSDAAQVPLEQARHFTVYRPETIRLAAGDAVRFTSTVRTRDGEHRLKNGDRRTVAGFDRRGDLVLDNGWVVSRDAGHLKQGYVETSLGSQGRTVKRVLLAMSSASGPAMSMEQLYVSATRAKQQLSLYTDDRDEVRDAIRKSGQKKLALDVVPEKPGAEAERVKLRQEMSAERRRRGFVEKVRAAWQAAGFRPVPLPRRWRDEASRHFSQRLNEQRQQEREMGHGR